VGIQPTLLRAPQHTSHSMAAFAKIVDDLVVNVIVVNDSDTSKGGVVDGAIGAAYCHNLLGGEWLLTSIDPLTRFNSAAVGYTYNRERDAFVPPKPYPSWVLDENVMRWFAPVPSPTEGYPWVWDEPTLSWVQA